LSDTGKPPTEEECVHLLIVDEESGQHAPKKASKNAQKRRKAKAKETVPEEEIAARRLEMAVIQMEGTREEDGMDID
jgi:hypothetical protein